MRRGCLGRWFSLQAALAPPPPPKQHLPAAPLRAQQSAPFCALRASRCCSLKELGERLYGALAAATHPSPKLATQAAGGSRIRPQGRVLTLHPQPSSGSGKEECSLPPSPPPPPCQGLKGLRRGEGQCLSRVRAQAPACCHLEDSGQVSQHLLCLSFLCTRITMFAS